MTYDPIYFTAPADSPGLDAFSRQRVSAPTLLIDVKRVGTTPDLFASNGVTDVYSLQVRNLSGGNEDYLGSITWREVF